MNAAVIIPRHHKEIRGVSIAAHAESVHELSEAEPTHSPTRSSSDTQRAARLYRPSYKQPNQLLEKCAYQPRESGCRQWPVDDIRHDCAVSAIDLPYEGLEECEHGAASSSSSKQSNQPEWRRLECERVEQYVAMCLYPL